MRPLEIRDLGRLSYTEALGIQQLLVNQRKANAGTDTLLFVEHPHVITIGRNAKEQNILASCEALSNAHIELHETDRGGDVTYHGPGQLVGYPILDLREWKRDVRAYFRGLEHTLIQALRQWNIPAERLDQPGYEGVWVNGAKIAAIGVHISRWITSHGFALNVDTELSYFQYIIPCGLTKPVCSLRSLGCQATREDLKGAIIAAFADIFNYQPAVIESELQETR